MRSLWTSWAAQSLIVRTVSVVVLGSPSLIVRLVHRPVYIVSIYIYIYWSMVRSFCGREATLTEQSPAGGGWFTAGVASGFPCRLLPPRPRTEVSTWNPPGCRVIKKTRRLSAAKADSAFVDVCFLCLISACIW